MSNKWNKWSEFIFRNNIHTVVEIKTDWEGEYIVSDKCEDCWYIWESDKRLITNDSQITLEEYSKLDLSNKNNWRANCNQCEDVMKYDKENFTYRCNCWNVLEV